MLSNTTFNVAGPNATKAVVMSNVDISSFRGIEWMNKARKKLEKMKEAGEMGDLDYQQGGFP